MPQEPARFNPVLDDAELNARVEIQKGADS
jgi:hypothetical protein